MRQHSTSSLLLLDLLPADAVLNFTAEWLDGMPIVPVGCTPSARSMSAQVYITASNGSAAPEHEDLGDAVILQMLGEKTWHYMHRPPRRGGRRRRDAQTDRVTTLRAGDALWLPASVRHRAYSSGLGPSVHLNLERGAPELLARSWTSGSG